MPSIQLAIHSALPPLCVFALDAAGHTLEGQLPQRFLLFSRLCLLFLLRLSCSLLELPRHLLWQVSHVQVDRRFRRRSVPRLL